MPPLQGCLPGLEASELRLLALFVFILVMVYRSIRCQVSMGMAIRFLEPLFVCVRDVHRSRGFILFYINTDPVHRVGKPSPRKKLPARVHLTGPDHGRRRRSFESRGTRELLPGRGRRRAAGAPAARDLGAAATPLARRPRAVLFSHDMLR